MEVVDVLVPAAIAWAIAFAVVCLVPRERWVRIGVASLVVAIFFVCRAG